MARLGEEPVERITVMQRQAHDVETSGDSLSTRRPVPPR